MVLFLFISVVLTHMPDAICQHIEYVEGVVKYRIFLTWVVGPADSPAGATTKSLVLGNVAHAWILHNSLAARGHVTILTVHFA